MVTFCSYCGADQSHQPVGAVFGHWEARCPDCGLVAEDDMPLLAPGGDEVEYSLAEWVPGDRILIRNALAERGVPWRWELGPVLVVDDRDQLIVELILDDLEEEAGATPYDDPDGEEDDDRPTVDDEVAAADEAPGEIMSELFVIADRLLHTPGNAVVLLELEALMPVVEGSSAPFGVEAPVWKTIRERAGAVAEAGEAEDEDAVLDASRELRDFLRPYV